MNPNADRSLTMEVLTPLVATLVVHLLAYLAVDWMKPECGNGSVEASEECDDGNLRAGDGCTPQCEVEPVCGDAVVEGDERCDDGNTVSGDGCNAQCQLEVQVREFQEMEPEPEPEPEVEPEVEPPPEAPAEPPPTPKVKKTKEPPPPPKAAPPPPPPAIELPADQTISGSNSGVSVIGGTKTQAGEAGGVKGGVAGGVKGGVVGGTPGGTGKTPGGTRSGRGDDWAPKSELYIQRAPRVLQAVKLECPAARDLGLSGTVVLRVQVRRNGTVKSVKVVKGIGSGCDEIAKKALRKTKFKPALGRDGKPADFEIARYEYVYNTRR